MQAVIYTRVSKLSGSRSVEDQESECRATCERNAWPVRAVFCDDGISASRFTTKDRPAWSALKAELREGDVLVVWEASRANRDLEEFVALRNLCAHHNVPLSYAGRILDLSRGDDRFSGGLDALISERESEQIKTRVLRGKRAAAVDGRPSGGRPPWGYRATAPTVWEPDPVEAPRVRETARRFLDGESQYAILRWLTKTPGWTPSSATNLQRAICSPSLAGLRVHRGEVVGPGTWQAILSKEDHEQILGRMKRLRTIHGYASLPGPEPKHLLSGIAVCHVCGSGMRHKKYRNRSDAYMCPKGHCCRVAEVMDRDVEKEIFELVSRVNPARHDKSDPRIAETMQEIAEAEALLADWTASAMKGEVSAAAFGKVEKSIMDRLVELKAKNISVPMRKLDVESLRDRWPRLAMREKREIVRALFTVTVLPAGRRRGLGNVLIEPII